jgi:hypothetical protein
LEQPSGELRSNLLATRRHASIGFRGNRLVEIHVRRLETVDAVESLSAGVFAAVSQTSHGAVIFADHRHASPVQAPVATAWSRDMRRANRSVARSGILVDPANVVFNLQLARVVHCAGSAARRIFTDAHELYAWLAERLDDDERATLEGLLTGGSPRSLQHP